MVPASQSVNSFALEERAMETVIRAVIVYLFLLIVFRLSGKRTLSEATAFDLVLLLIISETTQQAMVNDDHSMTNGGILILTLVSTDILLSLVKQWFPVLDPIIDGRALILVRDGKVFEDRLNRERIDTSDILEAARLQQGLENLAQVKLAVLERGGKISIVPK
jgi:uncharacterized membrane protein YcaP (DUF421 family)